MIWITKNMSAFPDRSCILECHCLLSLKQVLVWIESLASQSCQHSCLLGRRHNTLALYLHGSCYTPGHCGFTCILYQWASWMQRKWGGEEQQWTCIVHVSLLLMCTRWISFTKYKFKDEMIKNFEPGCLFSYCWVAQDICPRSQPCW